MSEETIFSNPVPPYYIKTTYGVRGKWWGWSLDKATGKWTKGQTNGMGNHTGYDFPCPVQTDCLAVEDGVIVYEETDWSKNNPRTKGRKAGNYVVLRAKGLNVSYAHLTTVDVKTGQKVKRGERIASSGATGNVTGPHLHISFRKPNGQWIPVRFMPTAYPSDRLL